MGRLVAFLREPVSFVEKKKKVGSGVATSPVPLWSVLEQAGGKHRWDPAIPRQIRLRCGEGPSGPRISFSLLGQTGWVVFGQLRSHSLRLVESGRAHRADPGIQLLACWRLATKARDRWGSKARVGGLARVVRPVVAERGDFRGY